MTGSYRSVGAKTRWGVAALIAILYGSACYLPAIYLDSGPTGDRDLNFGFGSPPGVLLLILGWTGGPMLVPWSANFTLWIGTGLWLMGRMKWAWRCGSIAAVSGLASWFFVWPFDHNHREPHRLLAGYYLWQGSLILLAVAARWAQRRPAPLSASDTETAAT